MSEALSPRHRPQRSDGEQSRERLLLTALRLFAQHGFAKTSTREIAEAAGTNLAAISYYFGDKAGLYRAVFTETQERPAKEIGRFIGEQLTLEEALRGMYVAFVEPLRQGDVAEQCMRLYMREILEPTGVWEHEIRTAIAPKHEALESVLCRHLGLRKPDVEVTRLAFSLVGLGLQLHVCSDVMRALAPALVDGPKALDLWLDRLAAYGVAMVEAERQRRAGRAAARAPARKTTKNKGVAA